MNSNFSLQEEEEDEEEQIPACLPSFLPTGNDPSAGSPTETLLRLLLPLNDQVWTSFRQPEAPTPSEGKQGIQGRQSKVLTKSFNR